MLGARLAMLTTTTVHETDGQQIADFRDVDVGAGGGVSNPDPFPVLTLRGATMTVFIDRLRVVRGDERDGAARLLVDPLRPPSGSSCMLATSGCFCANADVTLGQLRCAAPDAFCIGAAAQPYCSNLLLRPDNTTCAALLGSTGCACIEQQCAGGANCTLQLCDAPAALPTPPSAFMPTVR
jgi:hypothetical protein